MSESFDIDALLENVMLGTFAAKVRAADKIKAEFYRLRDSADGVFVPMPEIDLDIPQHREAVAWSTLDSYYNDIKRVEPYTPASDYTATSPLDLDAIDDIAQDERLTDES